MDRLSLAPFFIVYKARSGSTFLADLLVRHPQIGIAPESNFMPLALKWARQDYNKIVHDSEIQDLLDNLYAEPKFASWNLKRSDLADYLISVLPLSVSGVLTEIIRFYCSVRYPGSSIFGIKKGGWYTENSEVLRKIFPSSKFIHIIRDGRAVFSSSKRAIHSYRGVPFETDPATSALRWKRMVKVFDSVQSGSNAIEIQYEALITRTRETLTRILMFLDALYDSEMINQLIVPQEATFIDGRNAYLHPNVGAEPKHSRINAWREELSREEIQAFERIAGRTLIRKGYTVEKRPTTGDRVYELWSRASELMSGLAESMGSRLGRVSRRQGDSESGS